MTGTPDDVMQAARATATAIASFVINNSDAAAVEKHGANVIARAILAEREKSRKRVEELEAGIADLLDVLKINKASVISGMTKRELEFLMGAMHKCNVALLRKEGTDA